MILCSPLPLHMAFPLSLLSPLPLHMAFSRSTLPPSLSSSSAHGLLPQHPPFAPSFPHSLHSIPHPTSPPLSPTNGGDHRRRRSRRRRTSSVAGAPIGWRARYRSMSPAQLSIPRVPCLTIPPGLSPSAVLESAILLSDPKASGLGVGRFVATRLQRVLILVTINKAQIPRVPWIWQVFQQIGTAEASVHIIHIDQNGSFAVQNCTLQVEK